MTDDKSTFSTKADKIDGALQADTIQNVTMNYYGSGKPGSEKSDTEKPAAARAPDAADFGWLLARMCDRDIEDREFWNFFSKTCGTCLNRPHFYIVPGMAGCCHGSLVKRFQQTRVKKYIGNAFGETKIPHPVSVPLPVEGDLKIRQDILAEGLIMAFHPDYTESDYSMKRLCEVVETGNYKKHCVIFVEHDVMVSKWDADTQSLMEWYVKTYWAGFECRADFPLFLIFFNIIFPVSEKKPFWRRTTAKQRVTEWLNRFTTSAKGECECLMLPELKEIERVHVEQFFSRHRIAIGDKKKDAWIEKVFQGKDRISMMEVEEELESLMKEISNRMSGLHET